ncbi:hypothetical protein AB0I22_20395 [Streptomyces sp. NPDC050610]|uniref:hypothetical protein n=1 Tax=Streptomyces sp. NPDC050610 TaxID=3157097 RepID=UPI0034496DC0
MPSRMSRAAIAAGSVLLVTAGGTATAHAQQSPEPKNCVLNVDSGSMRCFTTFREAIAVSTHGQVTDAPVSAQHVAHDQKLLDRLRELPTGRGGLTAQLGILYKDWNYGGGSLTLNGGSACANGNGRDYTGELVDWNDTVSSVAPVGCWIELFADAHQSGYHQEYQNSTAYVGDSMNDRASSYALL